MNAQQQLNLILDLDRLIDETPDEGTLANRLAAELVRVIRADLGIVALSDESVPHQVQPRAVIDQQNLLSKMGAAEIQIRLGAAAQPGGEALRRWEGTIKTGAIFGLTLGLERESNAPGVILLARTDKDFTAAQIALVSAAGSQLDNALRTLRLMRRLREERLALQTILKMDRIRDTSLTLDDLLAHGLTEICQVIPAGLGFIMLYNREGQRLELRAATDQTLAALTGPLQTLYDASDRAIQNGVPVHLSAVGEPLRAVLGVPLILNDRVIGVLGVAEPHAHTDFTPADQRLLKAICSQMDTAIFEQLQTQRLRETFGRSVGPQVMQRLIQIDDRDLLKGERVQVSALFSDIRGFTAFTEYMDSEPLQRMLNEHLSAMSAVILQNEGMLDKFMGDGVMALFNVPERQSDHALRAVRTALDMQQAHQTVMRAWVERGLEPHPIGIGIAGGEAMVGNFGSNQHAEYSAVGACVNLAARLCAIAEGGQVLIDEVIYEQVKETVRAERLPDQTLKGFSQPVKVWSVLRL